MEDSPSGAALWPTSAISTFLSHILMVFSRSPFRIFSLTYSITGGARNSASCFRSFVFKASALARSWVGKDQVNPGSLALLACRDLLALPSLPSFSVVLNTMFKFFTDCDLFIQFRNTKDSLKVSFPSFLPPSLSPFPPLLRNMFYLF